MLTSDRFRKVKECPICGRKGTMIWGGKMKPFNIIGLTKHIQAAGAKEALSHLVFGGKKMPHVEYMRKRLVKKESIVFHL